MDLTAYFPAGMKRGDELSFTVSGEADQPIQTLTVVAAEDWHISFKSEAFAFSVSTAKNVASTSVATKIRSGDMKYTSNNAFADVSSGKLEVQGGFQESSGRVEIPADIETGYVAAQNSENPGASNLDLGEGLGEYGGKSLDFQLVV